MLPLYAANDLQCHVEVTGNDGWSTKLHKTSQFGVSLAKYWARRFAGGPDMELCGAEEVQGDAQFHDVIAPEPKVRKAPRKRDVSEPGPPVQGSQLPRNDSESQGAQRQAIPPAARKRAAVDDGQVAPPKKKGKYASEKSFEGRLIRLPSLFWGAAWAATQSQSEWIVRIKKFHKPSKKQVARYTYCVQVDGEDSVDKADHAVIPLTEFDLYKAEGRLVHE